MKKKQLVSAALALVMTASMPLSTAANVATTSMPAMTASAADESTSAIQNGMVVVNSKTFTAYNDALSEYLAGNGIAEAGIELFTTSDGNGGLTELHSCGAITDMSKFLSNASVSTLYDENAIYVLSAWYTPAEEDGSSSGSMTACKIILRDGVWGNPYVTFSNHTYPGALTFNREYEDVANIARFFQNSDVDAYGPTVTTADIVNLLPSSTESAYYGVIEPGNTVMTGATADYGTPSNGSIDYAWVTGSPLQGSVPGAMTIACGQYIYGFNMYAAGRYLKIDMPYVTMYDLEPDIFADIKVTVESQGGTFSRGTAAGSAGNGYITSVAMLEDFNPYMDIDVENVEVYQNAEVFTTLDEATFLDCSNEGIVANKIIPGDTTDAWFLKLNNTDGSADYYRLDVMSGKWEFRYTESADSEAAVVGINPTIFPDEMSGGVQYMDKTDSGAYITEGETWTLDDFLGGEVEITLGDNVNSVLFDYGDKGGAYYEYVGIDPVLVSTYGDRANGSLVDEIMVPSGANAGDVIIITGTDNDGNPVERKITLTEDNQSVPTGDVKDGTIVNETTGIYDVIEDGKPDSGDEAYNLTELEKEPDTYVITDMNGEVIFEGELPEGVTGDTLANVSTDLGIQSKQVEAVEKTGDAYFNISMTNGKSNAYPVVDVATETFAFRFDTTTDTIGDVILYHLTGVEGDVNQDGTFGVADIVMQQKYLLCALGEDTTYGFENYVAANVVKDNSSDVFDLCILKRMLLKQMDTDTPAVEDTTEETTEATTEAATDAE